MRLFLLIVILFAGISAQAQWQLHSITSGFDLFNSSFPSNQTGYVCGYGNRFYKTVNGGSNWTDLSFEGTAQDLKAVWFINNETGYLASTNDTIYKTSDGGSSWYYRVKLNYPVADFQFIDSLNGFAAGINYFSKTTNGGASWTTSSAQTSGSFYFLNSQTGWTTYYPGGGNSELHETTNGGATWFTIHSTTDFRILYDVHFLNQNTGWVCGYRHYIARTNDGGQTWHVQSELASAAGLYSIHFVNQNTGWTAGDYYSGTAAGCYYTTNAGENWQKESGVVSNGRLMKIRFSSPNTGWIVGQYGKVFKTDNSGGLTGINAETSGPVSFSLNQNYPNPFNPSTRISFYIPEDAYVSLKVFDILGREVASLIGGRISRGSHEINFDASNLAGGVYFCKLSAGNFTGVKRMVLSK